MNIKHKNEKSISLWLNKDTFEQLNAKLDLDNISRSDLLKTAVYGYLYGDYTLDKNGRKITCSINVE